jgi:orotate phosphoribosyltransferase
MAGGREAIEDAAGAPFVALTTIDEVYPSRPDR